MMIGFVIIYICAVLLLYIIALAGAWDGQFALSLQHYFVALSLIPLTRFFNPISAVTQALLAGVFVEGVGRWGFTWIYHNESYQAWLHLYMLWLKKGRDAQEEEERMVGAQVLGRLF